MFLPQFSLRWLLGATAVMAAFSLVASFGARGHAWAIGILAALGSLALTFAAYACFWLIAMVVGGIVHRVRREQPRVDSPFAMHRPAPQVLEPQETDP